MIAAGIDIGTSHITVVSVDLLTKQIVEEYSIENPRIPSLDDFAYIQDPQSIESSVHALLSQLQHPISSIGVTGQVHGILYYDADGRAISPLYTWLDRRGSVRIGDETPQQRLFERSGICLPSGYGLLTHYANTLLQQVPEQAAGFTGILEYITGRLTDTTLSSTDPSSLATFGAFDLEELEFDQSVLTEVLSDQNLQIPSASSPFSRAGSWIGSIPVGYPVGDNQAGFFGVVPKPDEQSLISIGTSGQFSLFCSTPSVVKGMELRPYLGLGYLQVGATLSAGKSYEILQRLFQSILQQGGMKEFSDEAVYAMMEDAAKDGEPSLKVQTTFNGTRQDPQIRGSIENITLDNFYPGNLVLGTVDGIVRELHDFTTDLGKLFDNVNHIIATGSAVRKNRLFRESIDKHFRMNSLIPQVDDGAAVGAALIGAVSAGNIGLTDIPSIVQEVCRYNHFFS